MGSTATKNEISAALGDACAALPDVEQLELLPPLRPTLSDAQRARAEASIKRETAGRPPGARNRATAEMLEFVRKLCGDPLERRFRWAMHTPESLAIELNCTKLEAFDRLERMWADLARFFYGQKAQVDAKGNAVVPHLTMLFPGQAGPMVAQNGAPLPPWLYIEGEPATNENSEENQPLVVRPGATSHGSTSHEDDK